MGFNPIRLVSLQAEKMPHEDSNTQGESHVTTEAENSVSAASMEGCWPRQKLEETRKDLTQRQQGPADTWILDFWPPLL